MKCRAILLAMLCTLPVSAFPQSTGRSLVFQEIDNFSQPNNPHWLVQIRSDDPYKGAYDQAFRLSDLRNYFGNINVDMVPQFLTHGVFQDAQSLYPYEWKEDWGCNSYRSSPQTALRAGDEQTGGQYRIILGPEDGFGLFKNIHGRLVKVTTCLMLDLNALPRARIAYGRSTSIPSQSELHVFVPFEKAAAPAIPFGIIVGSAIVALPKSPQHSRNIETLPGTTTALPMLDPVNERYQQLVPGICLVFFAISNNYPRPEQGYPNGAPMSSARNYLAVMNGMLMTDWGYEGYFYTTEDVAMGGLPPRQKDWAAHYVREKGDRSAIGWDDTHAWLLNCSGLKEGEKPFNLIIGSIVIEHAQYPLWIIPASGKARLMNWDKVAPGTDEYWTANAMLRGRPDPLFIDHYDNNPGFQLELENKTTNSLFQVKKVKGP